MTDWKTPDAAEAASDTPTGRRLDVRVYAYPDGRVMVRYGENHEHARGFDSAADATAWLGESIAELQTGASS